MNKLFLIIQREYFSRVKKKSFLIMSVLGPLLIAAVYIIPIWLGMRDTTEHNILVLDRSGLFVDKIENTERLKFDYSNESLKQAKEKLNGKPYDLVLELHYDLINNLKSTPNLYYKQQPGITTEQYIINQVENILFDARLQGDSIDRTKIDNARRPVKLLLNMVLENGKDKNTDTERNMTVGFISAIIIYMFIFLYGTQVMRGVMEEKTNRIVEVLVSSVKPFQLMLGKIIGIAFVSLTQIALWIVITIILNVTVLPLILNKQLTDVKKRKTQTELVQKNDILSHSDNFDRINTPNEVIDWINYVDAMNKTLMISCFLFYALVGYLLYAALFAAVGAAVDSETDSQQFIVPLTVPLIFAFVISTSIVSNPSSGLAQFFSIFPLTSPIVMMVRLPFDVPVWELLLSMLMLIVGFLFFTWLAGKIYRTGILMYGKKTSWKELGKWLFYKG